MVPGETVVVTKEVLKVVEVRPGYVTDPSTGKVVVAPEYGGSIADVIPYDDEHTDMWWGVGSGRWSANLVLERMGTADWALGRDVFDFKTGFIPLSALRGQLAESYDISPDGLTFTFHIRKGVYWQDKPPMNGRELVAEDIVFNFHRFSGMGSGFTEPSAYAGALTALPIESIEATDKYTVVFKLTKLNFFAFDKIYFEDPVSSSIYPPEVIQEHGDAKDWRNLVGTGPYELTDWVKGSAYTYTKNPNYWGYDEKFPENRLPYLDEVKMLIIPDNSTKLAALRTGKVARLTDVAFDQGKAIQKRNPELLWTTGLVIPYSYALNLTKPPFDDIRVRTAMQLALDNETINNTMYGGLGVTTPHGLVGPSVLGFHTPIEEWPEEVKANYDYDPERAEALLDAAGYKRGADGIRFSTSLMYGPTNTFWNNIDNAQLVAAYWAQIGVDVEIDSVADLAAFMERSLAHTYGGMTRGSAGVHWNPLGWFRYKTHSDSQGNTSGGQDPVLDAMIEAAENAGSTEEMMELVKEANDYLIEQQWNIWTPIRPSFAFWQPWMVGYNGELGLGGGKDYLYLSRVWLDSDLRYEMTGTR